MNRDGSVSNTRVIKGVDKDIDQAAMDAVSQWKFDPGTYEGHPIDVEMTVTVNFRLGDAQKAASQEDLARRAVNTEDVRNMYSDASEAYSRGDYATAANLFRKIISISPQHAPAWNDLGRALMAMNQLDAAAEAFAASIKNDPANRNAYNNLGLVHWRQRRYEEAEADFRKQMVVNPDDHYAHRNLGMVLRDQHRCKDAMPEIEKALTLTPNHAETMLAQGECDLDLGNRAKGLSELLQATSVSSAPNILNSAAYALARRNIEIGTAEKWSKMCLSIEEPRLQNVRLDHLTAEQLNYVFWMAAYWDTRGWIYFLGGDTAHARSYLEASWSLKATPTIGDHLGQIYEKLGRLDEAANVYAMAIASAEQPTRSRIDADDLADAKQRLAKLAGDHVESRIERGRADLSSKSAVSIANPGTISGSADFAVRVSAAGKAAEFHQLSGDAAMVKFVPPLQAMKLPIQVPELSGVEVPLRGTLTCHSEEAQCRFAFLNPEEAVNIARNESALLSVMPMTGATRDPHVYDNPAMGMRISMPDDWRLIQEEPGSFSRPRNAMFGKSGSMAVFMLTRERFEGSPGLYQKMLEAFFSKRAEYKRAGEEVVKRDGLTGTRWNISWNENGIAYLAVMEMFDVGDDHYRMTGLAPKEVYDRYAETFENLLRSVEFPVLRLNPQLLDATK